MRRVMLGAAVVWLVAGAGVAAAADEAAIIAPIKKFMEAFNKGDAAGAAATHSATPDLVILDEVPPYAWTGANAFQAWASSLEADAKANGITDESVAIGAPTRLEVNGDSAYVIVPSTYSFKLKGVAMKEVAQMTFVVKKGQNGWLIHGWTWTGPKATKAAGGSKG